MVDVRESRIPRQRFMSGQCHSAQLPPGCARCVESIFRSSAGGAARERWRRSVPPKYRAPGSRCHRTSVRLTHSSPVWMGGHMRSGPVSSQGAGQRSTAAGGSTTPSRQCSLGAAWWYGPGPALPRGPSLDGLKTDSTGDGLKTNKVDVRESRIPRHGGTREQPPCTGISVGARYPLTEPTVLACGPVRPGRPGYRGRGAHRPVSRLRQPS